MPLNREFQVMCDCLELLHAGIGRSDPHQIMPPLDAFVAASVIDIFKRSEHESASFTNSKFGTKVGDWFAGATRYGNGCQTNNIVADASELRIRNLIEAMHADAPEARLSRGARLSAAVLDSPTAT
jgi:hypothetical protein